MPDYGDRIAALEDALASEVAARTAADAELQANLEAETAERIAADADLSARVEALKETVFAVPTGLDYLVHGPGNLADTQFDLWVAMWLAPGGGALERLNNLEPVSHNH